MNKAELSERISGKTGLNKKQVEEVLDAFEAVTVETLRGNGEVTLTGFGTFSARVRKARGGVNPQNPSERIQIPTVTVPKFKAGKNLKDALKHANATHASLDDMQEDTARSAASPSTEANTDEAAPASSTPPPQAQ